MNLLAIIPARGGSKRIPGKNIRNFAGKPIIQYSLEAALQSSLFGEVMVSTDNDEIANISREIGAQIPFFRKGETSGDFATLADVISEVLVDYALIGKQWDYVCCILPTAPFISTSDLKKSFQAFIDGNFNSLFPVVRYSYPIQRALRFNEKRIEMFWPENLNARSQDLEPTYHDAGLFYWIRASSFVIQKRIFTENSGAFELPEIKVQDIDNEDDWILGEMKFRAFLQNRINNE
jgi:pseudaminic acid cytidylyltransferase